MKTWACPCALRRPAAPRCTAVARPAGRSRAPHHPGLLRDTNGHRQRAAELLGISRRTLSRKLKLCRIESAEGVEACPGASAAERWSDDIRLPGKTA